LRNQDAQHGRREVKAGEMERWREEALRVWYGGMAV
jgi:hypothetical protein